VIGGGSLGSLFAGKLSQAKVPVLLVSGYEDHCNAIQSSGLEIMENDVDHKKEIDLGSDLGSSSGLQLKQSRRGKSLRNKTIFPAPSSSFLQCASLETKIEKGDNEFDFALFLTSGRQTASRAGAVQDAIGPGGLVVTLQNG
tara:strand:- start:208 stop:633 length:426 start_codon:yes stop_codon:yes gene_type:complete